MGTLGLQTYIWNNNLKSLFLLLFFPLILLFFYWAIIFAMNVASVPLQMDLLLKLSFAKAWNHIHIFAAVALGWFFIAYFFHTSMIGSVSGAVLANRTEEKEVYNVLENLCILRGIKMPQLAIIESEVLNAFASGVSQKTYRITLTRGLVKYLTKEELESVLGHELVHIINKDVRLLTISTIFVGIFGFFAQILQGFFSLRGSRRRSFSSSAGEFSSSSSKGRGAQVLISLLIIIAVIFLSYWLAILIRLAISRRREFVADAGSIELTKNPQAMIDALKKISANSVIEDLPDGVAQMCIADESKKFFSFLKTHPPVEERIREIELLFSISGNKYQQVSF